MSENESDWATLYSSMSWKDFEDHVISILAYLYSRDDFQIVKTPYQNDGGRDGQGSLVIGPRSQELGIDFSIVASIWAEVKKRSSSSVDIDDIGGHLLLALDQKINKLIFVTNSTFSNRARVLCLRIADRLNMGVVFIDGAKLAELEAHLKGQATGTAGISYRNELHGTLQQTTSGPALRIRFGFASTLDGPLDDIDIDLDLDVGEVAYWICEVDGSVATPGYVEIALSPEDGLQCAVLSPRRVNLDRIAIHQRITAAVWADAAGRYTPDSLSVTTQVADHTGLDMVKGAGSLQFRNSVLRPTVPVSRQAILDAIGAEYRRIVDNGGIACISIEAIGGAGKTFLLNRLRQAFMASERVREIHLDGARGMGLDAVVAALLHQILPLPGEVMSNLREEVIADWLTKSGASGRMAGPAAILSSILAGGGISSEDQDVIECLASVLISSSVTFPMIITFEDLHKTSPAVFDFIHRMVGAIAVRRKGRIMVVLTTRPDHPGITADTGANGPARIVRFRLDALSRDEASNMLQASLRGIAPKEVEALLEHVGSSPFALREALQFLRTNGAIAVSPDGLYFLAQQEKLRTAISAGTLRSATQERLRWLVDQVGDEFASFLLAGACLGKQFNVEHSLAATGAATPLTFDRAVALCFDYDVLKPVPGQGEGEIAFDHDLVRNAILEAAGAKSIARISGKLLDARPGIVGYPSAILSYLAGRADVCIAAAAHLLAEAKANKNRLEAVQFALLRAVPLIASDTIAQKMDFLRPHVEVIDEALGYVAAPRLASRPSPRQMISAFRNLLGEMEKVGMLEGELAKRIITLAQMHAGYATDNCALSEFVYFEGRRLFGTNHYAEAYQQFLEAEKIWPRGTESRSAELAPIRLRQAICERHLGDMAKARATMERALRLRCRADWQLFESVVANLGAFSMYEDQNRAAAYWSKGLRVARLCGHVEQTAHFLNDLAHISLMQRDYSTALSRLGEAEQVIESHGLRKELTRTNILRGCIFLCLDRLAPADYALLVAEDAALANSDLRRLWRIRANMATLAELRGQPEDAVIRDLQSLSHMPISAEFDGSGTIGGRANRTTGALINIIQRAMAMPDRYDAVREKLGADIWRASTVLAAELAHAGADNRRFAGGIACLCHPVGSGSVARFLITE